MVTLGGGLAAQPDRPATRSSAHISPSSFEFGDKPAHRPTGSTQLINDAQQHQVVSFARMGTLVYEHGVKRLRRGRNEGTGICNVMGTSSVDRP